MQPSPPLPSLFPPHRQAEIILNPLKLPYTVASGEGGEGGGKEGRLSWIPQRIKPHKFHGALRGIIGMRPYIRLSAAFYGQMRAISMRLYAF